jgi:bifunctional UDP-N-acetylglucosamine pyrophosphorylase/glucosamine-1-phosphate N-acetyltransferase
MQTVLLAAGRGSRMGPLTARRPKPTLPVADRPLVAHVADAAVAAGASRLVVVVGYRPDRVRDCLGTEHAGVPVAYATQAEQRGTADAVRAAVPQLEHGPFAVLNADTLFADGALARLYDAGPAVAACRVDDPSSYGVLLTAGDAEDGRVTGVVEKPADPPGDLVNAGAYVLPGSARDRLDVPESERGEREFTDVLDRICETAAVQAVTVDRWLDVGRPWDLLAANEWHLGQLDRSVAGEVHATAELRGRVAVEPGATVDAGVVIEGPALLSRGATVGPNAYVRGPTLLGPDATVGHAVEVKRSVLMAGATVAHLSYVGDSILGRDANFGAGTTVANLRHDGANVELTVRGERVSTGRRKFGVVCGDDARTGVNTSLDAGVTLPVDARTGPGETVLRDPD